jgi:hypothetical protein
MMIINHASKNWENFIPTKVKTLVLGSFNPLNDNDVNANYYYGRKTNYLWKAIGDILYNNQQYFFNNGLLINELAKNTMEEYGFYFMDLVKQISIIGNDENFIQNFVNQKIHSKFNDSELFRVREMNFNTLITRFYNCDIIKFMQNNKKLNIIHTLGNSRISQNFVASPSDLHTFINTILQIAIDTNSSFIPTSISPSQVNINRNRNYLELKNWLQMNLEL